MGPAIPKGKFFAFMEATTDHKKTLTMCSEHYLIDILFISISLLSNTIWQKYSIGDSTI
jgi:hypothetical protein